MKMNKSRMSTATRRFLAAALCAASAAGFHLPFCFALPSGQPGQQATSSRAVAKRIGAIKAINGNEITLTPDSGPDVKITVQAATQIVRFAPGETNVNNATTIQLQDLQIGDRIRATGWASDDSLPLPVLKIVVMKHSDLEAKHQQDLQDWQKRGVGGLVKAVDPGAGTVTISVRSKDVVIHSSSKTVIRRYAPGSAQFDEAKPGTLKEVHSGDQVTARGDRSADGSELTAEEIVSGSFPIITATINSVDAGSSTLNVHDLSSKRTVLIKVTQDSQLHHVPAEMAQMFAMRLKGATGAAVPAAVSTSSPADSGTRPASPPGGMGTGGNGAGARSGGGGDFQRLLDRLPAASLADLHKGDAVIIVSTEGTTSGSGTAIKLYSGVEPLLQAAPNAAQAMMLAPWSLGGPSGDAGGP
jgi:hypothetical protein